MNKLFLIALLGFALIALTGTILFIIKVWLITLWNIWIFLILLPGAENDDNSLQIKEAEDLEIRGVREPNPAKNDVTKKLKKAERKAAKKALKKEKKNKARKSKKAFKKEKKNKARKSKKASKKGKRKAKGNRSSKSGSARQTCTVSDSCISNAVSYLKIVQNQVANFKNQKARIERQNTTGSRKNDKKDVFAAPLNRLVDFAGGNKTAPKCGSLESGAGVDNINNLTKTLSKCSDSIKAACDISALPQPNKTFVDGKHNFFCQYNCCKRIFNYSDLFLRLHNKDWCFRNWSWGVQK